MAGGAPEAAGRQRAEGRASAADRRRSSAWAACRTWSAAAAADFCGEGTIARLVGVPAPDRPHVYADTSPAELGVGAEPQVQINGEEDGIAPPGLRRTPTPPRCRARGCGHRCGLPDTGHVELISPGTAAWSVTVRTIQRLLSAP